MRLFLLLSALLASLTGLVAGAPAQARAGEPAAIMAAANAGAEQVCESAIARGQPTERAPARHGTSFRASNQIMPSQLHAVDERRIE